MELTIRLAREDEKEIIAHLDHLGGFQPRKIEEFSYSIDPVNQKDYYVFLAEIDDNPVGKVEVVTGEREGQGLMGYIRRLVVHPDFRRQGIATQLLQHLKEWGREKELSCLDLHVPEENEGAANLYSSFGFNLRHKELHFRLPLEQKKKKPQQISIFDLNS